MRVTTINPIIKSILAEAGYLESKILHMILIKIKDMQCTLKPFTYKDTTSLVIQT